MLLVRSYRTLAPLPVSQSSIGGMFLWHYPHGHPHWALPSKFGLSEARTFLGRPAPATTYASSSLPLV